MSPGDRMKKGLDFMLKGIGPKDGTPESDNLTPESGVTTQESEKIKSESSIAKDEPIRQESGVVTLDSGKKSPESCIEIQDSRNLSQESRIMTQDSGFRIQEPSAVTKESSNMTPDSAAQTHRTRFLSQKGRSHQDRSQESGVVTDDIIELAVTQAMKSPKISLYSPLLLAVLESQQLILLDRKETTLLQYRKATKARELVENALKESYPELCEKILKKMNSKSKNEAERS